MSKELRQNQSLQLTSESTKQILYSNNPPLFYSFENNDQLNPDISFFGNNDIFYQPKIREPGKGIFEIYEDDDDKNSIIIYAKNNSQKTIE